MIYANVVSTLALLIGLFSVGWQVYTWLHQKKREETPTLKVCLRKKQNGDFFVIENVGLCGITILDCTVNNLKLGEIRAITDASHIINARIEPQNCLAVSFFASRSTLEETPIDSPVKLKIKVDSGKIFEIPYTLTRDLQ